MITDSTIEIDAPAALVWEVFADPTGWPAWTESVDDVIAADGPDLAVGRTFRIKQPRLPGLDWTVTELTPGESWTWEQRSPGGHTVAWHELTPIDGGRTRVRQGLDQRGALGSVFGRLFRGMTRRYLSMEAEGLKTACEARHRQERSST